MKKLLFVFLQLMLVSSTCLGEADEKIKLEEVVVTATRVEEETEKIPSNVTVITEEDIKKSAATSVPDLLRGKEGLIIRDLYGAGTKSTVDMRGFGRGLNTVILIDGRRVNEIDLSGVDWNTIPLENIERIEIVRGNGSILYGDNAMSGAINIITKKGTTPKTEIEFDARIASYNSDKEYFTLSGAAQKLSYFLLAKQSKSDGYRDNSEYRANDLNSAFTVNIADNIYIDLKSDYHKDHQGLPGGLTEAEVEADRKQATHPEDEVNYEQYFYGGNLVFSNNWGDVEVGYNFNSREFDSLLAGQYYGSPYSSVTVRDTDTDDVKLKFIIRKNLANHKNIFVAGIDYLLSKVEDKNVFDYFSIYTTKTDLKKKEVGFYVEDEFFVSDRLTVIGGYRYTTAKFEDKIVTDSTSGNGSQKFNESAVKAGMSYNYIQGAKIFANYSKGFRLPTTDELFAFDGTVTQLRPERADTYEAGIVHPFGKNTRARLTLYHMKVKDELFLNPAIGFLGANENIEKTKHQGAEIGVTAALTDAVSAFGSGTYNKTTIEAGLYKGKKMPLIPNYSANFGAEIKIVEPVMFIIAGNWVGRRYLENDLQNTNEKLPDYLTLDTKLSYKYKAATTYAGVNNVFNKKYSEYGVIGTSGNKNFYPAPERQFYAGIKMTL